jgi:hypothetical protein
MRNDGVASARDALRCPGLKHDGLNMDGKQGHMFGSFALIVTIGLMPAPEINEIIAEIGR